MNANIRKSDIKDSPVITLPNKIKSQISKETNESPSEITKADHKNTYLNNLNAEKQSDNIYGFKLDSFVHYINPIFSKDFIVPKKYESEHVLEIPREKSYFSDDHKSKNLSLSNKGIEVLNRIIGSDSIRYEQPPTLREEDNMLQNQYKRQQQVNFAKTLRSAIPYGSHPINKPQAPTIFDLFHPRTISQTTSKNSNGFQHSIPSRATDILSRTTLSRPISSHDSLIYKPLTNSRYLDSAFNTRRKYIWRKSPMKKYKENLQQLSDKYKENTLLRDLSKVTMQWAGYKHPESPDNNQVPKKMKSLINATNRSDFNSYVKTGKIVRIRKIGNVKKHNKETSTKLVGYMVNPHYAIRTDTSKQKKLLDVIPDKTNATSADKKFIYRKVRKNI